MLWTIVAILLILWLLGFSFHVAGGLVHVLLVVALVVMVFNLLSGRRSVPKGVFSREATVLDWPCVDRVRFAIACSSNSSQGAPRVFGGRHIDRGPNPAQR